MSPRPLRIFALAFVLASACTGDGSPAPCLGGMVREPGPACTLPPTHDLTIDGNLADWTSPLVFDVQVPGSCCRAGDTGVTNAGRQLSDGALVFYSNGLGFPGIDPSYRYGLAFRRADLADDAPGNVHTLFLASTASPVLDSPAAASVEEYVNGERVYGAPGEATIGFTGIEWRIPTTALPYPGAAYVVGVTFEIAGGEAVARDPSTSSAKLCWDVDAVDADPCRAP